MSIEWNWQELMFAHEQRVDELLAGHLQRRAAGQAHPVEDFLFTYYSYRPAQLRRWHPGFAVALPAQAPHAAWSGYVRDTTGQIQVDPDLLTRKQSTLEFVRTLQKRITTRPAHHGCLGLHEWAMVYRADPAQLRHAEYPLRLGAAATDEVVDAHRMSCSHYDAYRFFTEDARPHNTLEPTRDRQVELDQPGCLHVGMDLYKWSSKLSPLVPSELVVDCFVLARDIRTLDMRASPYDLSSLGYSPVRIETPEGRAEYIAAQRAFTERAAALRERLLAHIRDLTARGRSTPAR